MAVHLTRIYTRTGDNGTTALGDGSRVPKTDARIEAFADVDETNAAIGAALALGGLPDDISAALKIVQNDLFDVGADMCAPVVPDPPYPPQRVSDAKLTRLEGWCVELNARL
jgi:cob(I)alamin adenosyltransferase